MSKTIVKSRTGAMIEVDNSNSGAVFPYSETEMIGPFQFDEPNPDLTIRLGMPDEKGRMPLSITLADAVVAKGYMRKQDMSRPTKTGRPGPNLRGSVVEVATGEILPMVGWKKLEAGTERPMIQIHQDNRPSTGSCFI